jgi:Lon-like protease
MTTASVSTPEPPTPVPDEGQAGAATSRRRRRWWILGTVSLFVVGAVLGVLFVPTPYYLLEPGAVRPSETRIRVQGAKSFDDGDGAVLFTTVFINRATIAGLIRGAFDDAIDVESKEDVYGTQTPKENKAVNQLRMDTSKLVATKVALNYLGYPADFTGRGARVIDVVDGGPSDGVLEPGDVITHIDDTAISLPGDISTALGAATAGQQVNLTVSRGSGSDARTLTDTVTLGLSSDAPQRPILGVSIDPVDLSIRSDVTVSVDSGEVTGPSAGLAWTLAIIDRLTPGSLTGGTDVAVTGEIENDGTIGPIGAIVQKVATVKRAGVKEFIYPAATDDDLERQMREVAGGAVELHPVHNIDEAVKALAPDGVSVPG